jgi:uncharacterized protein
MAIVEFRPTADVMGRTQLHYAALFGDLHGARALIDAGAGIAAVDRDGQTPLHYAAQGNAAAVAELLLDLGAPVDAEDLDGSTPLWHATIRTRGEGACVRLLLDRGADPHHRNQQDRTSVELAQALGGAWPGLPHLA